MARHKVRHRKGRRIIANVGVGEHFVQSFSPKIDDVPEKMQCSFTCEQQEFVDRVYFVRAGLGTPKTRLGAQLIRFELRGSKLIMFAADTKSFVRTELDVTRPEGDSDGAFSILGSKIDDLAKYLQWATRERNRRQFQREGNVTFDQRATPLTFKADERNVEVKSGPFDPRLSGATVNFEAYDSSELRSILAATRACESINGLLVPRTTLMEAFVAARHCRVSDPLHSDVNFSELRNGQLVSTDGSRTMVFESVDFSKQISFKIPHSSLPAFSIALENCDADDIMVANDEHYFYLLSSDRQNILGVRRDDRTLPAVEEQVLAVQPDHGKFWLGKDDLASLTRKTSIGASLEPTAGGEWHNPPDSRIQIGFSLSQIEGHRGTVEISHVNKRGGKSHETIECGLESIQATDFRASKQHVLAATNAIKPMGCVDIKVLKTNKLLVVSKNNRRTLTVEVPVQEQVTTPNREFSTTELSSQDKEMTSK